MYYIMENEGTRIIRSNLFEDRWCVLQKYTRVEKYDLSVLNYSDWSITKISVNTLMSRIAGGVLPLREFVNLDRYGDSLYTVVCEDYFDLSRDACFVANNIIMHADYKSKKIDIEVWGDRYLSLRATSAQQLEINYAYLCAEKLYDLTDLASGGIVQLRKLLQIKSGYSFDIGETGIRIYLYATHFVVIDGVVEKKMQYMGKVELARKCLLLCT